MASPNIILENLNLTILFSVIALCLTALGIFRRKPKDEELPGKSPACLHNKADFDRMETNAKENTKKIEDLKQLVNDTSREVSILKNQSENTSKNLDEMKQDVKEVASKLDDLLKQLLEWTND